MAGMGYGAGRFLPQDFSAYQEMFQPQTYAAPQARLDPQKYIRAFQPNYSLFWNPQEMLAAGQPAFADPWYIKQKMRPLIPEILQQQSPQIPQPLPSLLRAWQEGWGSSIQYPFRSGRSGLWE